MTIGPMIGISASVAGVPVAQAQGSELDRLRHDAQLSARRQTVDDSAERAAGIGETPADNQAWEHGSGNRQDWEPASFHQADTPGESPRPALESNLRPPPGTHLDLIA